MKTLEIINWHKVERVRRSSDLQIFVQFTSGRDHYYSFQIPQQAEEMMDSFGRYCIFGLQEANGGYVITEQEN